MPAVSISRAVALIAELNVTTADTDATDTLDVEIQDTTGRVAWNTRARFVTITGDLSPSATAPEVRRLQIVAQPPLATSEQSYETTGSAGASDISAGSVVDGPFMPPYRNTQAQGGGLAASLRVVFTVVDAGTQNASFAGTLSIWAVHNTSDF